MRKSAPLSKPVGGICRVMSYETANGTFLFLYDIVEDGPCKFDHWFESLADAEQAASESFSVRADDWVVIDDPIPEAQHDWISPTRVKTDAAGNKIRGQFEAIAAAG